MLHPEKARVASPARVAADLEREIRTRARPAGDFDASRYFRATPDLGFHNVGTPVVRALGRDAARSLRATWTIDQAVTCVDRLLRSRYLEVKGVGVELLSGFRKKYKPALLPALRRWFADDRCDNWATTDAMCGTVLGPLLTDYPQLIDRMHVWSRDRNLWVRRASIVGLLGPVRAGLALDDLYVIAERLHPYDEDLIHKAVGWALREAGKRDEKRLERYLRAHGPSIPRTTVRYAIERYSPAKRRELLIATKGG